MPYDSFEMPWRLVSVSGERTLISSTSSMTTEPSQSRSTSPKLIEHDRQAEQALFEAGKIPVGESKMEAQVAAFRHQIRSEATTGIATGRKQFAFIATRHGAETVVLESDRWTAVAWFPLALGDVTGLLGGRVWAGGKGNHMHLFCLEGIE